MARARPAAALAALAALACPLTGCSGDDEPSAAPTSGSPESPAPSEPVEPPEPAEPSATAPFGNTSGARTAAGTVEAYYAAGAQADCITMRLLSSPTEQRADEAWATCLDTLQETGLGYTYEVVGERTSGRRATVTVAVTDTTGTTRRQRVGLVRSGPSWLVDDGFVTR